MDLIDLTGKKFDRLTVVGRSENNKHNQVVWSCLCDCGNKTNATGSSLKSGHVKSCGCLNMELLKKRDHKIHGLINHRLYEIFISMKMRCYNKNHHAYKNYGGRGISICKEWKNDIKSFYNWAIGNGYERNLTIDRINNNIGYSPENCRWATRKEQARNRSTNKLVCYDGTTKSLSEWCEDLRLNYGTIIHRINILGWDEKRALSVPIKQKNITRNVSYSKEHGQAIKL